MIDSCCSALVMNYASVVYFAPTCAKFMTRYAWSGISKDHKFRLTPGVVEKTLSTVGPLAGKKRTPLQCRCNVLSSVVKNEVNRTRTNKGCFPLTRFLYARART